MNILILTTHLNPGGISRYVLNLAKGLKQRKHTVWVASSGGEWIEELESLGIGNKYIPINTKSICSLKIFLSFLHLSKFIISKKISIVHSNTRVTQCLGSLIYRRLGIPYVSAFHGFYRPSLFRKIFAFSGLKTIAVSKSVRSHLRDDLIIPEAKIRVIYNGLDFEEFFLRRTSKKDWGFRDNDYLVGILGRISEEKGHFLAVEAIKELSCKYKNLYLVISGAGRLEKQLKEFINLQCLNLRVKFLSLESKQFLDIIDLLIVPSKKEGFGYSIIEAFAKKVPVVGYSTGGIAEIIDSRENGLLFYNYAPFALAAAIEEVMLDDNLRKKIVNKAHQDIHFFSLAQMALETEKVYREVVEKEI